MLVRSCVLIDLYEENMFSCVIVWRKHVLLCHVRVCIDLYVALDPKL